MENVAGSSGITIPLFLKQKWWKKQQEHHQTNPAEVFDHNDHRKQEKSDVDYAVKCSTDDNVDTMHADWKPRLRLQPEQALTRDQIFELSNRVFTASELEECIRKTQTTMFEIQKQLHRGEEIYYEDTYNHGSIYKGWDAFVDMKDIGTSSASGSVGTQTSSIRRVPADSRWFSTSCGSISRTQFPLSFPPPLESNVSSTDKLLVFLEKGRDGKSIIETQKSIVSATSDAAATATIGASAERNQLSSTVTASTLPKSSTEDPNSNAASSTSKAANRLAPPVEIGICLDLNDIRKKRKPTTSTPGSNESHTTKSNRKSSDDGTKRHKIASTSKVEDSIEGTRKGTKSDNDASASKGKLKVFRSDKKDMSTSLSHNPKKAETFLPAKQEKVDTSVPRKRGRPRRKS